MNLTDPQLKVLAELRERGKLYFNFWNYYFAADTPANRSTVEALIRRKLIEYTHGDPSHFVITPAGRAALSEAEAK